MIGSEAAEKFEQLFENHKDVLIEAAHGADEEVWINLCKVYGFRAQDEITLRDYIRARYPRAPHQRSARA